MKMRSKELFPVEERAKRALWLKKAAPALDAAETMVETLTKKSKKLQTQIRVLSEQYKALEDAYSALEGEFNEYKEITKGNVNTDPNDEISADSATDSGADDDTQD